MIVHCSKVDFILSPCFENSLLFCSPLWSISRWQLFELFPSVVHCCFRIRNSHRSRHRSELVHHIVLTDRIEPIVFGSDVQDICKVGVSDGVMTAEKKNTRIMPHCWIERYAHGDLKQKTTVRICLSRTVQNSQSENKQVEAVIKFGIVQRETRKILQSIPDQNSHLIFLVNGATPSFLRHTLTDPLKQVVPLDNTTLACNSLWR